jgi:predicted PurR-regulated permease PerM
MRTRCVFAFAAGMLVTLWLGLLPAAYAALAAYGIAKALLRLFSQRLPPRVAWTLALLSSFLIITLAVLLLWQASEFLWAPGEGFGPLLRFLADTIERLRAALPPDWAARLPESADDLQRMLAHWLRSNSRELQHWGGHLLHLAAYVLIGIGIGLLAAFTQREHSGSRWMVLACRRFEHLQVAFNDVFAAQVRIAAVNAVFTGIFLLVALPLAGHPLPLARTLVLFTFAAGLIPIIGNLLSNTAIIVVGLTVSPGVAVACLVFLVVIHKLEYFLNAHLVGHRTSVAPHVLLGSMLVGEAAFGLSGLVAAPVFAAWLVREGQEAGIL